MVRRKHIRFSVIKGTLELRAKPDCNWSRSVWHCVCCWGNLCSTAIQGREGRWCCEGVTLLWPFWRRPHELHPRFWVHCSWICCAHDAQGRWHKLRVFLSLCRKKNPAPASHSWNGHDHDSCCYDNHVVDVSADPIVLLSEISYAGVKQTVSKDESWPCKMADSCGDVYPHWIEDECVPKRTWSVWHGSVECPVKVIRMQRVACIVYKYLYGVIRTDPGTIIDGVEHNVSSVDW